MPKKPRICTMRTTTSIVGSAPLTNTLMKTQSKRTAHRRSVPCQPSREKLESRSFKLTSCSTKSATKKHTEVSAAIQPMTVSQPGMISVMILRFQRDMYQSNN